METIIKQSADGIILSRDNNFDTNLGKVFINNHEITDIDTFFKVAEENTRLLEQVKKQKEVLDKLNNYIDNYDVFKVFSFPLMKKWEENQVKSSIDYEFKTSLIKDLKDILKENQELKKQVDEYQKELGKADNLTQICIFKEKEESKISYRKCLNMLAKKETQQKEFIKYLEDLIKQNETVVQVSKYGLLKIINRFL